MATGLSGGFGIALGLLLAMPATAALDLSETVTAAAPRTGLSLAEAVDRGLRQSPRIGGLLAEEAVAEARLRQQRAGRLPQVDLSYRYGRDRYENISVPNGDTVNRSYAEARLSQALYRGGAISAGIEQREAARLAAGQRSADGRNQLALEIATAYGEVLVGRRQVEVAEDSLRQHEQIQGDVKLLVNAGVGRRPDVELAQSRISIGRGEIALQTQRLREAEARFQRWVGLAPGPLEPLPELAVDFPPSLEAAITQAMRRSDALAQLRAEVVSAQHAYAGAKSAYYPQLDLVAAWSSREDHDGVNNGFRDEDSSRVELVASLNAFSGGLTRARVAEQAALLEAAKYKLAEEEQRLRSDLSEAWAQMEAAELRHQQFDSYAGATAEVDKVYRQQFAVRLRSLLDLLDAVGESGRAQAALAGSEQDRRLARLRVLAGMGVLAERLKLQ